MNQSEFRYGLSSAQREKHLATYGKNKLPQMDPPTKLSIFVNQFKSPLIYIMLIAAILTMLLGDVAEAIGISLVVLLNSALGFVQENRAETTLSNLRNEVKPTTTVLRDGKEQTVDSQEITVGDVIVLRLGDKLAADGILISAEDLTTNESVLTGESRAVNKKTASQKTLEHTYSLVTAGLNTAGESELANAKEELDDFLEHVDESLQVFMGTAILSGIGTMLVTRVGPEAKFGEIAHSLATESEGLTPLQIQIDKFGQALSYVIGLVSLGVFVWGAFTVPDFVQFSGTGFLNGIHFGEGFADIVELSVSVAVSAVPEGLVIALTIILTLGMRRILQRKALVRKLIAAETLGSVDTICVDKTGTLTEGKMRVTEVRFTDMELGKRALLANTHQVNAVDISIFNWLSEMVSAREKVRFGKERIIHQKIFSSETKFAATLAEENLYVVGAPELILEHSEIEQKQQELWSKEIRQTAKRGSRIVAVATKPVTNLSDGEKTALANTLEKKLPGKLTWNGLILIDDPVRPDLSNTFRLTDQAGISIKIITGDIQDTAVAVLKKVGIHVEDHEIISGKNLKQLNDQELTQQVEKLKLFYRTTPDQKLHIVKALQRNGHSVAMMGDGINDTPALKKAEIGIVVNNATSFSKEIADMVLLDSNFKTIVAAIKEGRTIFDNMRKVLAFLLSDAFEALSLIVISFAAGIPVPLTPLQILFTNFVTDGLPDLSLAFENSEKGIMSLPPRRKDKPLLDKDLRRIIAIIATVITFFTLALYLIMLQIHFGTLFPNVPNDNPTLEYVRTVIFLVASMNSLIYIYSVKNFRKNIWEYDPFDNNTLNVSILLSFIGLLIGIYVPFFQDVLQTVSIGIFEWLLALVIALVDLITIELLKKWKS